MSLTKGNKNHLLGKLHDDLKNNKNIILKIIIKFIILSYLLRICLILYFLKN